jgi:hypothetical protein
MSNDDEIKFHKDIFLGKIDFLFHFKIAINLFSPFLSEKAEKYFHFEGRAARVLGSRKTASSRGRREKPLRRQFSHISGGRPEAG